MAKNVFSLPNFPELSDAEVAQVVRAVRQVVSAL
jgi:dTDP-4-amino-4,6-dideoxygalactose transaminase